MLVFWAVAAIMVLATAGLLLRPLLRNETRSEGSPDLEVYRDQLAEVDRDQERGVVDPGEADALRTEIKRRLLGAADGVPGTSGGRPAQIWTAGGIAFVVTALLAGVAGYGLIGAPGAPDQPLATRLEEAASRRAERPSQAQAEEMLAEAGFAAPPVDPQSSELIANVRAVLADRPDDLRGHRLLVSSLSGLGQYSDAADAQAEVLRILGDAAGPDDHLAMAELLIFAANSYVSPEAEAMLALVLEQSPDNPPARYFSGLAAWQAGRADLTYDLWSRLLLEGPEEAPWVQAILPRMGEVSLRAGREIPGAPSQAEMEAAEQMDPSERDAMIRGMVTGLADRLDADGGPAEDWARLIRAWGVLGEVANAAAAWEAAQAEHAEDPVALTLLRQAAQDAEVAQ